jgi:hypothetical protein
MHLHSDGRDEQRPRLLPTAIIPNITNPNDPPLWLGAALAKISPSRKKMTLASINIKIINVYWINLT